MKKINSQILKITILILYLIPNISLGQNTDFKAGILNIGVGGIVGGVGAIINKNPQERYSQVLVEGMIKGALGGYFVFESKRMIRYFDRTGDYVYVWPSKLINAVGVSIIENSAANRPLHESFSISIGFSRIELSHTDKLKMSFRIKPIALIGTIITSTKGELNLEKSLKTGNFVFTTDHIENGTIDNGFTTGRAAFFGSSILIIDTWEGETSLPHEIVHLYQIESFSGINKYLNNIINYNSKPYLKGYSKIFYTEFHALSALGLYNLSSTSKNGYSGNIFEKEANYFTGYERPNPQTPSLFQK